MLRPLTKLVGSALRRSGLHRYWVGSAAQDVYRRFTQGETWHRTRLRRRVLRRLLGPAPLIFDIGANEGHTAAVYLGIGARVVCVEPDPTSVARLRRRCRRVYSSARGLNVPGVTPAVLLRDPISVQYPAIFNRACIEGALDHYYAEAHRLLAQQAGTLPATRA